MRKTLELIEKVVEGYASSEEKERLMIWRLLSDNNELLFQKIYEEHQFSRNIHPEKLAIPDKEKLWHQISKNLSQTVEEDRGANRFFRKSIPFLRLKFTSVAAVLLLGFLLATALFYSPSSETCSLMQTSGSRGITTITLNDGSEVCLNRGSALSYTNKFGRRTRDVRLKGEAYFDIAHDSNKPFTVTVRGIKVKVLGTAFNVKTSLHSDQIEVTLDRGKVSLFETESLEPLAVLSPHEKAILTPSNDNHYNLKVIKVLTDDDNLWRAESVTLEDVSAEELIHKLEKRYGVKIDRINEAPARHYWLTIRSEPLSEVLELINKITPIIYKIDGK